MSLLLQPARKRAQPWPRRARRHSPRHVDAEPIAPKDREESDWILSDCSGSNRISRGRVARANFDEASVRNTPPYRLDPWAKATLDVGVKNLETSKLLDDYTLWLTKCIFNFNFESCFCHLDVDNR